MPTVTLTDRRVASLKPAATRREYFDRTLPGFGLRVSPRGVKSWTLLYRVGVDTKLRRITLGTYPDLGLSKARDKARDELQKANAGRDPGAEKQTAKAHTFEALADLYIEKHAKRTKRSWREDDRRLRNVLIPEWCGRPVTSIRRAEARELLEGIVERGKLVDANRTLALIRRVLNFGIEREWLDANVAAKMKRPGGAEASRARVLSADELRLLWKAWDALDAPMAAFFKLRLMTAQRGAEVQSMRWQDVDLESGWWTIPEFIAKNKQSHRVPLTATVTTLLTTLRRAARAKAVYVVEGARGKRQQSEAAVSFPVKDFRGHDLRRTAASMMTSGGVPRLVVSKILNHAEKGVTAVYDRHSYDAEKQAALTWWDATLTATLENKPGAVRVLAFQR